jgi:hypothetical protein
MLEQAFSDIANGFSQQFGAPFVDATARWTGSPVEATDGSIATPAAPVEKTCRVQISAPTEAMRLDEGFRQTDMRLIVLAASIDGTMDTDATVIVSTGAHAGTWSIESASLDTAAIGWTCRGRLVR